MVFTLALLLVGFVLLVRGADIFVEGSSSIAKLLRIPPLIIGLTIVAFGTSAPELAVSITAALDGSNALSYGNIVGSNIFNILIVVGLASIISPQMVQLSVIIKEFPFALLSCVVIGLFSMDIMLGSSNTNVISSADGIVLLLFFCIFMYYLIESAVNSRSYCMEVENDINISMRKSIFYSVSGIFSIIFGGKMVVTSSVYIATTLGISEALIGLTIVAIGTSLPELVTSIVAAKKGECDIAMGNAIGSNIFNAFFILGVSASINPIPVDKMALLDLFVMLGATILAYIFAISHRKISRFEGSMLTVAYVLYFIYIIVR